MYIKQLRNNKQKWRLTTEEKEESQGRKNVKEEENRKGRHYGMRKQNKWKENKMFKARQYWEARDSESVSGRGCRTTGNAKKEKEGRAIPFCPPGEAAVALWSS